MDMLTLYVQLLFQPCSSSGCCSHSEGTTSSTHSSSLITSSVFIFLTGLHTTHPSLIYRFHTACASQIYRYVAQRMTPRVPAGTIVNAFEFLFMKACEIFKQCDQSSTGKSYRLRQLSGCHSKFNRACQHYCSKSHGYLFIPPPESDFCTILIIVCQPEDQESGGSACIGRLLPEKKEGSPGHVCSRGILLNEIDVERLKSYFPLLTGWYGWYSAADTLPHFWTDMNSNP